MADEIKLVYTGSVVEAMYVEDLLKENEIGSLRKDHLQSSIDAGWADGLPGDSVQVFVEDFNFEKAKNVLDTYFSSRGNE